MAGIIEVQDVPSLIYTYTSSSCSPLIIIRFKTNEAKCHVCQYCTIYLFFVNCSELLDKMSNEIEALPQCKGLKNVIDQSFRGEFVSQVSSCLIN